MESLLALITVGIVLVGIIIYSAASWGFVLMKFWIWFVLPVFPALPQLAYLEAVGLMFAIGLFQNHDTDSIKEEYKTEALTRTGTALLTPWLTLACAWLVKSILL